MANQTKSYRKFVASAATATLVATALVPVASAAPADLASTFTDVAPQYEDAVNYLVNNDITNGKSPTQFGTSENILRADAAVWIAKAVLTGEQLENAKDSGFTDVPARAKNYVDALKENNVINGINATQFGSNRNIKRGDVARILAEAYQIEGNEGNVTFTDVAPQYKAAVAALLDNDITAGKKGNRFGTDDNITRGELAIWIQKLELLDKDEEVGELKVQSAEAISATLVEVKFNDGKTETYTVDELKVGEATEIEVEYKEQKFKVTVTWKGQVQVAPGTVAFANQPAAKALPQGSQLNEVYSFQLTAGEDAINLRSVQLKQYGTISNDDEAVTNVHLAVNGDIKATGTVNANGEVRLTRSVVIPANSTVDFKVLADIGDTQATATVQFGIESINAFTANATLNGSFPNVGNSFNIVAGNIGTVKVFTSGSAKDVKTGDVQEEIGKFRIQADSKEGVKVNRVTLTANGFNADDFENLYLYDNNGADRIDVVGIADRSEVVFDLSKEDLKLDRNQSKTFVLKGDPIEAPDADNGIKGWFSFDETYHVVTQGLNTGYNNGIDFEGTKAGHVKLADVTVKLGDPKFRVSPDSPKSGDKIVASTSEFAVVREYTLNPSGQDVTLKDAHVEVHSSDADLFKQVRAIELYDANSGSVLKTIDIKDDAQGTTNNGITKFMFQANNLNWFIDKEIKLQIRAVANDTDSHIAQFDALISDETGKQLVYDVQLESGKKKTNQTLAAPATQPQYKEFTTKGDTEVQRPGSSARVSGYSVSAGLSDALLGNLRLEAKEEEVKIEELFVKLSDGGTFATGIDKLIANPVLKHDGKVVAYGEFKQGNSTLEFDFNDDFTVETGKDKRKVLELHADILENDAWDGAAVVPMLTELETRGVKSNIVSTPYEDLDADEAHELLATGTSLDYRETSIQVTVSKEAIDATTSNSSQALKFTVRNLSKNNPSNGSKDAYVNQLVFKNLFNFPTGARGQNIFDLRDDKAKVFEDRNNNAFRGAYDASNIITIKTGAGATSADSLRITGNDSEEMYLYADFSKDDPDVRDSIFKNVRFRLDALVNPTGADPKWLILDSNNDYITPLFINNGEGPEVVIKD